MAPEGLTKLANEAMIDIAHLLRPSHLQQLRNILDDPEASKNDRFVALELLKNANIAAGAAWAVSVWCCDGGQGRQGVNRSGAGSWQGCTGLPAAFPAILHWAQAQAGRLEGPLWQLHSCPATRAILTCRAAWGKV